MSGKKTLQQMQEELEAKQEAERRATMGVGRFRNGPTALSRVFANRPQDRVVVDVFETGRVQQPPTVFPRPKSVVVNATSRPLTCGTISGHIARARAAEEECSKQVKFFRLLETKYGAVKGNDYSYEEAMMRYHNDKDVKMKEKMKQLEAEQRREDRFRELNDDWDKATAVASRFPTREQKVVYAHPRGSQQEQQQQYEQQAQQEKDFKEYWQREQDHARAYAHAHAHSQYEPPRQNYARGGPSPPRQRPASPKKRTPTSPRSILIEQYPIPHTRREAIAVMGLPSHPEPTDREIKLAFNAQALRLHPDKNAHNSVEAAVRFDQLHHAYKLLRKQAGGGRGRGHGNRGRHRSRYGRASRASRYRRKTHHRRHSIKIYKKKSKNNTTTRKHK